MPRVYVSTRRSDSASMPGRIIAALGEALSLENIVVSGAMTSCDFVIVIMGNQWATAQNQYGFSSLYDPNDFVRVDIETALSLSKIVIPVLVDAAEMPIRANVPITLAPLLDRPPMRVRDGADFDADMQNLVAQLDPQAAKPAPNVNHIFLSYSRKDTPMMQRLRDDLRVAKLEVWADDNLEPGTSAWEKAISAAIRSAGCLVVILSPDAEQSTWVGRELAMAETLDKRIFPILARGSERDAIPFRLMSHQWVDARHNYTEAFDKLLGAVNKYLMSMS
ncbi:MAG: toll/interleukin-1 receptor domain-containing protein [Chloroflexota bacterium]